MMNNELIPVLGGCVRAEGRSGFGIVQNARDNPHGSELMVYWPKDGVNRWINAASVRCGFKEGMEVQDIPWSRTRRSLGRGRVLMTRSLGGRDQVLVEFFEEGRRIWVPYENLRHIRGVEHAFLLGRVETDGGAERFRLRTLAHALESWNANTGSLSRLDIDPLPHQIHLVHHILASGNLNWLIADDVGLGKTIEVGMLLSALGRRGTCRRVLLVTPAGLVKQWQEELYNKFGMEDFLIYGTDFEVNEPRHWKMYDRVIGSIDRFKSDVHQASLLSAEPWDLVIFDEAHRLSRRQWGQKFEATDRFRLAVELRKRTDAMLQLTATPHQGKQDRFEALLELLRPELKDRIRRLDDDPEILREMVIRNHKADVTDADGKFIFRGKTVRTVPVQLGDKEREFDSALQRYLREGYAAGQRKGRAGFAIGFVMTTYRKLAASSIAAIQRALGRRLETVRGQAVETLLMTDEPEDERYFGEWEESVKGGGTEFFHGEVSMLMDLIALTERLKVDDRKLEFFMDRLLTPLLENEPTKKVVIFTEYRATQDHLAQAMIDKYGEGSVVLINGSMAYWERTSAIESFEGDAQFLISTEAGGEGVNLHRHCHVMINYDLPWNPMRLVQRIGRLYRYGQKAKVVVFNMQAPQTFDAQIMDLMYERLHTVAAAMASLGSEFNDGLADEILGELADTLNVEKILEEALHEGIPRTRERIDEALERARVAVEKQRELFQYAAGFDPEEAAGELRMDAGHVAAFVEGMCAQLGIEIVERTHSGRMLDLRLPADLTEALSIGRSRVRLSLDRALLSGRRDVEMADADSPLFRLMLERARSQEFGGFCAGAETLPGRAALSAVLRWQDDQGRRMREEYSVFMIDIKGSVEHNPVAFSEWLRQPVQDGGRVADKEAATTIVDVAKNGMNERLGALSNRNLHPEGYELASAAWGPIELNR